jgi:hypothetical protein
VFFRRKLQLDVLLKKATTNTQKADLVDQCTRLGRNIARFHTLQSTYTPVALRYISDRQPLDSTVQTSFVEATQLYLPSALAPQDRSSGSTREVANMETALREGQCCMSLEQIWTQLHIKSHLLTYKGRNVCHQGLNTRARALIDRNDSKIKLNVLKYREACVALLKLEGVAEDVFVWQKLEDKDIRCMEEVEQLENNERRARAKETQKHVGQTMHEGSAMSEGHRTISWLFLDMEMGEGSLKGVYEGQSHLKFGFVSRYLSIFNIALRSKWAKAWARMRHWSEEVLPIKEEMRRVLQYHEHRAIWWESKDGDHAVSASHADGIAAYAHNQVNLH